MIGTKELVYKSVHMGPGIYIGVIGAVSLPGCAVERLPEFQRTRQKVEAAEDGIREYRELWHSQPGLFVGQQRSEGLPR